MLKQDFLLYRLSPGWKVPHPGDSQRQPVPEGSGPQVHHQVPDEEGALPQCRHRERGDDGGGARPEHPPRHELPRVAAEEALAEREESPRQVHHGPRPETVLIMYCAFHVPEGK